MTASNDMAQLHALCFDAPPPWRAEDFAGCLSSPLVFVVADAQGVAYGFALGRVVADEAELLTLAILPTLRRQGRGRALLAQFHSQARQRGAQSAFLEVSARNAAACALYVAAGYQPVGRRAGYYGPGHDGVVMRLGLDAG